MSTRIDFPRFDETPDAADYAELCHPGPWQFSMLEEDFTLKSEALPLVLGALRETCEPMTLQAICERIAALPDPPMPVTVHGAAIIALTALGLEEIGMLTRDADAFALAGLAP